MLNENSTKKLFEEADFDKLKPQAAPVVPYINISASNLLKNDELIE